MRPQSLSEAVCCIQAGTPDRIALAEFLDEFYTAAVRQPMIDEGPALTGNAWLDAYVGGMGEHLARRWDLKIPEWTEHPGRFLHEPAFPDGLELLKPMLIRDSPIAFRRRLIFTEAEPLRRARFPR